MAQIARVEVQYISDNGKERKITLEDMARHCRVERVRDLLDDLVVLCEDVMDGRHPDAPRRMLSVVPEP